MVKVSIWVPASEAPVFRALAAKVRGWFVNGEIATVQRAFGKGDNPQDVTEDDLPF